MLSDYLITDFLDTFHAYLSNQTSFFVFGAALQSIFLHPTL